MPNIPKEPSAFSPDETPQQYPGFGVIHSVDCAACENVPGIGKVGMPTDIKYNVTVNLGYGAVILQNVPIANPRPNVRVIAYRPGDMAGIFWSDGIAYFQINEPPYFKPCDDAPGGGTPPPVVTPPPTDGIAFPH